MALTWPLVQEGSTGEDVRTVQHLVTAQGHPTGVDGDFGPQTKTAVQAFQSSHGLGADGIVGPQTWPLLIIQVKQGSNGDAVRAVQSQIHSRGDGANQITVDGIFGSGTNDAVRAFQTLALAACARSGLDTSSVALDMTNFATFIDTGNGKAPVAQRGKAKQKRSDLRLAGLEEEIFGRHV